jgi:hypothetical protein
MACGSTPPAVGNIVEILDAIKSNMGEAYEGDKVLNTWMAREFSRENAPATDEQAIHWIDTTLPASWNFREDVVVFCGDGLELVKQRLELIGQRRILCLDLDNSEGVYQALREYRPRQPFSAYVYSVAKIPDQFKKRINDALRDNRVFGNTVNAFAAKWIQQAIPNIHVIATRPPVYQIGPWFADKPFVIVAPGPSLDKNIAQLRLWQDKAIICTVSHALKILEANGVRADFVLTVDSSDLGYHFEGCDTKNVGALVTGITCHPSLWKLPCRNHFYMGANASADTWIFDELDDRAMLPAGGSVATTAVAMAVHMRCSHIIAVGLDCALAGDGKMYSKDSHDADVAGELKDGQLHIGGWSKQAGVMMGDDDYQRQQAQDAFTLPGYYGGEVHTTYILNMFHSWFASIAAHTGDRIKYVNCTEGGAFIPGWEHIPLDECFERYVAPIEKWNVWGAIDHAVRCDRPAPRASRLRLKVNKISHGAKKVANYAGKAIAAIDANDRATLERCEGELLEHLVKVPVLSLLMQPALNSGYDRAGSATSSYETLLATKEIMIILRKAAEYVREIMLKAKL